MSSLIKVDNEYKNWITEISNRFRQTQLKAAVKTNCDMLMFYWSLGRDFVGASEKNNYGTGFYKTISDDFKDGFRILNRFRLQILNTCDIFDVSYRYKSSTNC